MARPDPTGSVEAIGPRNAETSIAAFHTIRRRFVDACRSAVLRTIDGAMLAQPGSIPCDRMTGRATGPVRNLMRSRAASGAFEAALTPAVNTV